MRLDIDKGQEITVNDEFVQFIRVRWREKSVFEHDDVVSGKNHAFAMYNIVVGFLLLISSVALVVLGVGFWRKPKLFEKRL